MKLLTAVLFALVSGIFSSTTAQYENPSKLSNETLANLGNTLGIADIAILLLKHNDVVKQFRKDCETNGGPKAYSNFVNRVQKIFINYLLSSEAIITQAQNAITYRGGFDQVNAFVKTVCPIISTLSPQIRDLMDSYKACLEPNSCKDVDSDGGVWLPILDYTCQSEGLHIRELLSDIQKNCSSSRLPDIKNCINQSSYLVTYYRDKSSLLVIKLFTSNVDADDCDFFENIKSCIVGSLNTCENSKIVEVVNSVIGIIEKHTICKKRYSSPLSSAGLVNVISKTTLMATTMFMLFV